MFVAVVWVAVAMIGSAWLHTMSQPLADALKPGPGTVQIFPALGDLFLRSKGGVTIYGFLPVMPMTLICAALVVVVSLITKPPRPEIIAKYFPPKPSLV